MDSFGVTKAKWNKEPRHTRSSFKKHNQATDDTCDSQM